jgi:hypothetical protein
MSKKKFLIEIESDPQTAWATDQDFAQHLEGNIEHYAAIMTSGPRPAVKARPLTETEITHLDRCGINCDCEKG